MFNSIGAKTYEQMHDYLARTWKECYRVLKQGGLMCINIGDATRSIDHRFKIYLNHSKIIELCESIWFESLLYIL